MKSHEGVTHIDEGVLDWLIEKFAVESFLDLGCGPMGMVDLATSKGLRAFGVDVDESFAHRENFALHNFKDSVYAHVATAKLREPFWFDVVWTIEVVEHIPEEYIDNFMQSILFNISSNAKIIMTHALPGSESAAHVNCRDSAYWIDMFAEFDFVYEEDLVVEMRRHSTMKRDFMRNTGKLFRYKLEAP